METNTQSQNDAILSHMLAGKSISPLEALHLFGCMRLGGRRYDLVKDGWDVKTDIVKENGKRFARYSIDPAHPRIES